MLSRVAESLYWMGRYLERAEGAATLLHVDFHAGLDTEAADDESRWRDLLAIGGHVDAFAEHVDGEADARTVTRFMLFDRENPDSVAACVERARENARLVRDQISTELWEHVNRLHHYVSDARPAAVVQTPHDFFARIRAGSHAFQGIAKATLPHGEAYAFLELGAHLERAALTGRIVNVKAVALDRGDPRGDGPALTALLSSCGAYEALRRQESSTTLRARSAIAFLLLDRSFPRSILFCVETASQMLTRISGGTGRTQRLLDRLCSELLFSDERDLHGRPLRSVVDPLLARIDEVGADVESTYFNTQALSPVSVSVAIAAAAAQQQQQQQ